MPKNKVQVSLEIESDHMEWLNHMADKWDLPDESKALRVLLDYAIDEADEEVIFSPSNMHCRHCGR